MRFLFALILTISPLLAFENDVEERLETLSQFVVDLSHRVDTESQLNQTERDLLKRQITLIKAEMARLKNSQGTEAPAQATKQAFRFPKSKLAPGDERGPLLFCTIGAEFTVPVPTGMTEHKAWHRALDRRDTNGFFCWVSELKDPNDFEEITNTLHKTLKDGLFQCRNGNTVTGYCYPFPADNVTCDQVLDPTRDAAIALNKCKYPEKRKLNTLVLKGLFDPFPGIK